MLSFEQVLYVTDCIEKILTVYKSKIRSNYKIEQDLKDILTDHYYKVYNGTASKWIIPYITNNDITMVEILYNNRESFGIFCMYNSKNDEIGIGIKATTNNFSSLIRKIKFGLWYKSISHMQQDWSIFKMDNNTEKSYFAFENQDKLKRVEYIRIFHPSFNNIERAIIEFTQKLLLYLFEKRILLSNISFRYTTIGLYNILSIKLSDDIQNIVDQYIRYDI